MKLYGAAQAGGTLTCLIPGDALTLFDGTETAAAGMISLAFARGPSPSGADNGITFFASGMPSTAVIDIQAANEDVTGSYYNVANLTPDANGNAAYTDVGRAMYYRAKLTTYVSGAMPVVKVRR